MKRYLTLIIILLLFCFTSCNNSYSSMLYDFNRTYFSPDPVNSSYSVNNSNFDASEMLKEAYAIPENMYIYFEAPLDGSSYSWKCINKDGTETELCDSRILYYKVPGAFKIGESNALILTVTVINSDDTVTEYIDNSVIVIDQNESGKEK